MNTKQILTASLPLLTLPLFAFALKGDQVAFAPGDGTSVSKALTFESTFYIDDIVMSMDGEELPAEMMGEAMDEGLLISAAISVTDEYVKTAEGKVLTLLRTYDELSLEAGPESEAETVDEFGELEDSTVEFKWDEEEDEFLKSYHESEGDEDLLENLDIDMDFLRLLPDDEVAVGDTWEVDGERLETIFMPGGMPAGSPDEEGSEEMAELFKEEMEAQFEEAFDEFVINCKYVGSREEDGVTFGEIAFKFDGEASIDLSELIQSAIDMQGAEMGIEADVVATIDLEFEGEGILLWNLDAGHVASFEMKGDITVLADVEADVEVMGESHSMVMSAEVSGEAEWGLEAE
jgi:hypothetical protein